MSTIQRKKVWAAINDGRPHTLPELAEKAGCPEQSVSARIRDFRKAKYGGHTVERTPVKGSNNKLNVYVLFPKGTKRKD